MHSNHPVRFNLVAAAHAAMIEHGFQPDFPAATTAELAAIQVQPQPAAANGLTDLRGLLWSSIDNDTSKDLDQIEWAEQLPDGRIRVLVGVADVDARVHKGTVIDTHAQSETTSVYTGVTVFPMLPTELSEGITSLNENEDRAAVVIEFAVDADGTASDGKAYRALVHNRAQLAYNSVGAWLEGKGARRRRRWRRAPISPLSSSCRTPQRSAWQAAASNTAPLTLKPSRLARSRSPIRSSISRALKKTAPRRSLRNSWWRPMALSRAHSSTRASPPSAASCARPSAGTALWSWPRKRAPHCPPSPDSKALNDFLLAQKQKDPDHFPDLSLAVVKLMGPGEYVLVKPNQPSPGHFGLAVQDYTHSTAPNRRFPDMVTQRLLKAWLAGQPQPYSESLLNAIALRCTEMEDAARKVEREMQKRIAAVVLHPHIGQSYPAIVTGVNNYGTFVRTLDPHVEGMLVHGGKGLDVGDKVTVKLVSTDPERGFIDFAA